MLRSLCATVALVAVLALALAPLAAAAAPPAQDLVARGRQALAAGDAERAAACFKAAIIRDVVDEAAWAGYREAVCAAAAVAPAAVTPAPVAPAVVAPRRAARPAAEETLEPVVEPGDLPPAAHLPAPTQRNFDRSGDRAWSGLSVFETVDPTALESPARARRLLDEEKKTTRVRHRRTYGGAIEAQATVYAPRTYKYMAVALGSSKGWNYQQTEEQYTLLAAKAQQFHEVYVELANVSSPRRYIFIGDVAKRCYLLDDHGKRYDPAASTNPEKPILEKSDGFTVWFPRTDASGKPLVDKAERTFTLVVYGLENPNDEARMQLPKAYFLKK